MSTIANETLDFWFGADLESPCAVDDRSELWFAPNQSFDDRIRDRFGALPDRALGGEFADWRGAARSTLALVLILDQFPRNLYRGTPKCFACDSAALGVASEALARGFDSQLHPLQAVFLYLPFEHAEDHALQDQSVSLFRSLVEKAPPLLADRFDAFVQYAERHRTVIQRFGRFPHRNSVLGRRSTTEERNYLQSGGDTF